MSDPRLKLGSYLRDKWRLDAPLGEGGMATVFAATHRNGRRGAIKILHAELARDEVIRRRFLREGYVANKVDHPGIVRILDDDATDDGLVYLVLELLEGQTVKAYWVENKRRLPPLDVLALGEAVLDVLAAAHAKGVIHRDVKPDNIFRTKDGGIKLLDFGIARLREGSADATHTGAMLGTPAFMAPEQALAHWDEVDPRSDLFSLAATLRTLLCGRLPHQASTIPELLVAAATKQVEPLKTVCPDAPPELCELLDKGLAFKKEDRWASATEMLTALARARTACTGKTLRIEAADNPFYDPVKAEAETVVDPTPPGAARPPKRPATTQRMEAVTPVRLQEAWPAQLHGARPIILPADPPTIHTGRSRLVPWLLAGSVATAVAASIAWLASHPRAAPAASTEASVAPEPVTSASAEAVETAASAGSATTPPSEAGDAASAQPEASTTSEPPRPPASSRRGQPPPKPSGPGPLGPVWPEPKVCDEGKQWCP